ncbi:hypothetical protein BDP81DRAFT_445312 [Colletotrichum phormii]|uniref:Uncharacterized protein n=1 Tax=Colletotrichum phormii TaxID=359342 RepID=A0AAJ0A1S0_9PEZI|nr:uncharacterized protein BDP81DRAFT_445312 [Colletotrichum phormii]KAK1654494.1 hypothetical protein BDP81DRAFT_445312 [Colletotrichum phormii]
MQVHPIKNTFIPYRDILNFHNPKSCRLTNSNTTALNSALEQLGFKVFSFQAMWPTWQESIPLWTEAIEAKRLRRRQVPHALLFAEDLAAAYPEARIIVSKRDYEPWRASMEKTVFKLRRSLVFRLLHPLDAFRAAWWPFLRLIMDTAYGGWAEAVPGRKPYDEHHARIEAITRETPERMLVFSGPKDGWVPLWSPSRREVIAAQAG